MEPSMGIESCRGDFPTMRTDKGVYLDSACQSLRPDSVIAAVVDYYERCPACGGRSVHHMSNEVTEGVDLAREAVCRFMHGGRPEEFVFDRNTTEGLNTVAYGIGLRRGDGVVVTDFEHNSNLVPWLDLKERRGVDLRYARTGKDGAFDIESLKSQMSKNVKIVSVSQCSNVTGCTVPIRDVAEIAHDCGALVCVDGSQAAPHMKVDLKKAGVDFYAMSMHKMLGPSGMGVLYGGQDALERLRPHNLGGGTVGLVTYEKAELAPVPDRFEAGLQDYAGIFGTRAAIEYLEKVGMDEVERNDRELLKRMMSETEDIRGLTVVGPEDPSVRTGVFSFNVEGLVSYDIAMMLDSIDGIMIRSGMHCAHAFQVSRGVDGSARASVYLYNNTDDVDRFATALRKIADTFGGRRHRRSRRRAGSARRRNRVRTSGTCARAPPHAPRPSRR